ncbi:MAG: hypothetical protein V4438_02115 [Patescibacteria group bacterium]
MHNRTLGDLLLDVEAHLSQRKNVAIYPVDAGFGIHVREHRNWGILRDDEVILDSERNSSRYFCVRVVSELSLRTLIQLIEHFFFPWDAEYDENQVHLAWNGPILVVQRI